MSAYQICQSTPPFNEHAELDEFIQFKGHLYTWAGAGMYGRAYSSVEPLAVQGTNQLQKVLIKFIPYLPDPSNTERQIQFDKEVELQTRAAQHQCGPIVYETGKGILLHAPDSPFEFQPNSPYCHYTHADYILMEYYDKVDGWTSLPSYQILGNNFMCDFVVNQLYKTAHVVVSRDAAGHFFYHPQKGYRMIDYGQAEAAEDVPMENFLEFIKESLNMTCETTNKKPSYRKANRQSRMKRVQRVKRTPYAKKGESRHEDTEHLENRAQWSILHLFNKNAGRLSSIPCFYLFL